MKWYWPEVSTPEGAKSASRAGAGVCFVVAGLTGLVAAVSAFTGKAIMGLSAWSFVDAALFTFAGWRVWRLSRTWAVIALLLYIIERIDQFAYARPNTAGVFITLVFTLALISSVRGTFAHQRLTATQAESAHAAAAGTEANR